MGQEEEKDDLRGDLAAAFEDKEATKEAEGESDAQPEVEGEPVPDAGGDEPTTAGGKESGKGKEGDGAGEESAPAKFLPPEGEGGGGGEEPAPKAEPEERVPVAWRGGAKAKWAEVPQEVRQEVLKREKEVNAVLQQTARSRKFEDAFQRTVAPFQSFMAADGKDPLTATRDLMQTAAVLRVGSPQQKAQVVADIVNQFGVDIQTLDGALAGASPGAGGGPQPGPDIESMIDQRMAPVNQFMQGIQQRAQQSEQALSQSVAEELEAFEQDPANLFFKDVEQDISVLMQVAAERGQTLSLKDAYDKAVRMNPELQGVKDLQQGAQRSQEQTTSLQQKKRAAASIQARRPQAAASVQAEDLRGALESAWDNVAGG